LTAPLSTAATNTIAQIYFSSTVLTNVTITIRACAITGDAKSAFQSYVQNAGPNYNGDYNTGLYQAVGSMTSCTIGWQNLTYNVVVDGSFDPTAVTSFSLVIQRFNASVGPWVDTTVRIDSITFSGGGLGPYTFDSNVTALSPNAGVAPTWLE
jgi:hypothetical protein